MNADPGPRVFTVAEVDALIPRLTQIVGMQLLQQSEIERALAELARIRGELPESLEVNDDDSQEAKRLKQDLARRILRYESGWREIQQLGALVKDPQIGLLDFYGHIDGRLVHLCWRYGEESLCFFHDLEAGYAGRRPLENDQRQRLLN